MHIFALVAGFLSYVFFHKMQSDFELFEKNPCIWDELKYKKCKEVNEHYSGQFSCMCFDKVESVA